MMNLHRWQNALSWIKSLILAADARLSTTHFTNDQSWEVMISDENHAPLTLRTSYGGRVQQATLAPQWSYDGRTIAQAHTYAQAPYLVAFAPAFAQLEGYITPKLHLITEYWVMESQAVGGRFTIYNDGDTPETLELLLNGDVKSDKKTDLAIITLISQNHALSLGSYPNIEPVILLEDGQSQVSGNKAKPIITKKWTIEPKTHVQIRFVHAGIEAMVSSLNRATDWLAQNWDEAFERIAQASQAIPHIETGDENLDLLIAISYHHLIQAFMRPTEYLPYSSFVTTRQPANGYSPKGDGSEYRSWYGVTVHDAYLVALGVAPIAPELAQGIVKNFLATQDDDGKVAMTAKLAPPIPLAPHLCPPILARLTWNIYQFTEDKAFLTEAFPKLLRFYQYWMQQDIDSDTMPEWMDERQMGYIFFPTFGFHQSWAQNVDIRVTEAPDMAAYMISEAIHLAYISHLLGKTDGYGLLNRLSNHQAYLERLWRDALGRYSYQDRDTNLATSATPILIDTKGDERIPVAISLEEPARLQIRFSGGTHVPPNATLHIIGVAPNGDKIHEEANTKRNFYWGFGNGFYTSKNVFQSIDELYFEGLSRVYRVNASTVDFTRLDINALMPLMLNGLPESRADALIALLTNPDHFWRPSGMTIVSAKDPNYDSSSTKGGGGTWTYWMTLIGEGLLDYGKPEIVTDMTKRLMQTQLAVYQQNGYFSEFYHSDQTQGGGEKHHISGIVPVYLLGRILGVQIFDSGRVFVGGKLTWGNRIRVQQHGVVVERSEDEATITFASGNRKTVMVVPEGTIIEDESRSKSPKIWVKPHFMPQSEAQNMPNRVIIQVNIEPDDQQLAND